MRSRVIVAALAALLLVVPAGCSDDKDAPQGPAATETSSTGAAASASASESASGPVAPTGPLMELAHTASIRVPGGDGWNVLDGGGRTLTASFRVDGGFFDVGGGESIGGNGWTLEQSGKLELRLNRDLGEYPSYKHTGNRVLNGVEVWVIEARRKDNRFYQVTGLHNGYAFRIDFAWPPSFAGGEELKEQILASVEWK